MKHMMLSEGERKLEATAAPQMKEKYPYGLRINLGKDELKKLGIKDLPQVGAMISLEAVAKVESVHASEGMEYKDRSVSLQITHLELEENESEKKMKTSRMMFDKMPGKKD